jgi:hypothetical protein
MTCKDAINSNIKSDDEKRYLLSENTRYNENFKSDLEGTIDQISKIKGIISYPL